MKSMDKLTTGVPMAPQQVVILPSNSGHAAK